MANPRNLVDIAPLVSASNTGNLGIGTTSPVTKLHVEDSAPILRIAGTSGTVPQLQLSSAGVINWSMRANFDGGSDFTIYQDSTQRLKIDSSGNVGIGTSSPQAKLDVQGTAGVIQLKQSSTGSATYYVMDTTVEAGGKRWRFGYTGGLGAAASTFSLFNATDNITSWVADASGNLGLGVTPSAWNANNKSIVQLQNTANLFTRSTGLFATSNFVYNSADTGVFQADGYGLMYQQNQTAGTHVWLNTPNNTSGAGATASLTSAMTLDASGNLGVGTTSPSTYGKFAVLNTTTRYTSVASNGIPLIRYDDNSFADVILQNSGITGQGHGIGIRADLGDSLSNTATAGYIRWLTEGSWSTAAGSRDSALLFGTTLDGVVTEKARITSGGNFGIGTTNPGAALEVIGTTITGSLIFGSEIYGFGGGSAVREPVLTASYDGSLDYLQIRPPVNKTNSVGNYISFLTGPTAAAERARITSDGNLLVGTTTTGFQNNLSVTVQGPSGYVICNHINGTGSGAVYAGFGYNGSGIGSITQDGTTAVLYNTTSDRRLKQNIVPAPSASDVIDAIQIVSHDWKAAPDEHVTYGVIAQDLHAVAPQAVSVGDAGDEIEKAWGVDYSKLVPMLIKEIQSLRARVAALESNQNP